MATACPSSVNSPLRPRTPDTWLPFDVSSVDGGFPPMHLRGFLKAGHWPTLLCAFLYFDISFMVWVLLGALANSIVPDLGLNEAERGFMLAIPLLGGSVLRLVLGVLTDHIGARRTG